MLTAMSSFQCMWITKDEYEDDGPAVVHTKCC